jgi:hypothetical protein
MNGVVCGNYVTIPYDFTREKCLVVNKKLFEYVKSLVAMRDGL